MAIWPISIRVNSLSNDGEHLLEEIALAKGRPQLQRKSHLHIILWHRELSRKQVCAVGV